MRNPLYSDQPVATNNIAIVSQLHAVIKTLLNLLFPLQCVACQQNSNTLLCQHCLGKIQPIAAPFCHRCGLPLQAGFRCSCQRLLTSIYSSGLNGQRSVSLYSPPLSTCIQAFKYHRKEALAPLLGTLLAIAYQRYQLQADLIVPVPLHPERQQLRGYNQAALLAQICAQQLQLPLDTTGLIRTRATPAQAMLSAAQRMRNVVGAFHYQTSTATQHVVNRNILIIDDVSTTGSTLAACAGTLKEAGANRVWGLVLARPLKPAAYI